MPSFLVLAFTISSLCLVSGSNPSADPFSDLDINNRVRLPNTTFRLTYRQGIEDWHKKYQSLLQAHPSASEHRGITLFAFREMPELAGDGFLRALAVFDDSDVDGNGVVDWEEFVGIRSRLRLDEYAREVRARRDKEDQEWNSAMWMFGGASLAVVLAAAAVIRFAVKAGGSAEAEEDRPGGYRVLAETEEVRLARMRRFEAPVTAASSAHITVEGEM
jgi:hypothetical protein